MISNLFNTKIEKDTRDKEFDENGDNLSVKIVDFVRKKILLEIEFQERNPYLMHNLFYEDNLERIIEENLKFA